MLSHLEFDSVPAEETLWFSAVAMPAVVVVAAAVVEFDNNFEMDFVETR